MSCEVQVVVDQVTVEKPIGLLHNKGSFSTQYLELVLELVLGKDTYIIQ